MTSLLRGHSGEEEHQEGEARTPIPGVDVKGVLPLVPRGAAETPDSRVSPGWETEALQASWHPATFPSTAKHPGTLFVVRADIRGHRVSGSPVGEMWPSNAP